MKNLITPTVILLILTTVYSCSKVDSAAQGPATIQGKWSVKRDSLTITGGAVSNSENYVGKPGDYFDFRSDNKLYIKEGPQLDTFSYAFTSDTTITLGYLPAPSSVTPLKGIIYSLTNKSVTIDIIPSAWNPGGNTTRITVLTK